MLCKIRIDFVLHRYSNHTQSHKILRYKMFATMQLEMFQTNTFSTSSDSYYAYDSMMEQNEK